MSSDGYWMPVRLDAEWTEPQNEKVVNVGNHVLVIALYMDNREPDMSSTWHSEPGYALIVVKEYMGSQAQPMVETFTRMVEIGRIRILGLAG